jgi:pyruvate-ferredoxin/flavodoxin oxidoreductase
MAISYGYVYVAKIAMGADYNQTIKAITEAESYPGPSLIIAYAPCIAHGIKGGLIDAQTTSKHAVESGYWNLFRFDPRLKEQGKNPFTLDSKTPTASPREFMMNEVRYNSLFRTFPDKAETLMQIHERELAEKRKYWERFAALHEPK